MDICKCCSCGTCAAGARDWPTRDATSSSSTKATARAGVDCTACRSPSLRSRPPEIAAAAGAPPPLPSAPPTPTRCAELGACTPLREDIISTCPMTRSLARTLLLAKTFALMYEASIRRYDGACTSRLTSAASSPLPAATRTASSVLERPAPPPAASPPLRTLTMRTALACSASDAAIPADTCRTCCAPTADALRPMICSAHDSDGPIAARRRARGCARSPPRSIGAHARLPDSEKRPSGHAPSHSLDEDEPTP